MSGFLSISTILKIAQVCEYLSVVNISKNNILTGGDISENQARLIYMERMAVQNRFNLNPSDPTLQGTANYLLSICRQQAAQAQTILNNLADVLPVITGPANQSVSVGATATFSVSVVSSTNVTYQWYLNNVLIPGATTSSYLVNNAQLTQSGGLYSVTVTNTAGPVVSNQATLTVTATLVGFYYQGTTDYSGELLAATDSIPYLGTFPITTGQPLNVTFPNLVSTQYIVVKYPATEPTKTTYLNPPPSGPDSGTIPSISLEGTSFGGWKYIFSRPGNTFGLNNSTGTVEFS